MTRTTNSRIAGFALLGYIAAGIVSMVLFRRATSGEGIAAKLAGIAAHTSDVRLLVLLGFAQSFSAIALGVTLYALTRDEDADLAMLGLVCRVGEGVIAGLSIQATVTLLWLSMPGTIALDATSIHGLAAYLLKANVELPATFFAVGSTAFSYLLLRGRMIPTPLAWLGVAASTLLVVGLPLSYAGWLDGPVTLFMWLPMLAFEVPLALWLLTRGAAMPQHSR